MKPARRLLFVITSLDRGGAQRQVVDLAARLRVARTPVAVLSMIPPAHYVDELVAAGVEVHSLDMRPGRPTPLAFLRYGRFLRRWRPDLIHSHMVHANLLARLGRIFLPRVPVVGTVHNVTEGARWREIAYRLTDWLATRTTAVSEAAARRYVEVGAVPRGRIVVLPNGFDFARRDESEARAAMRAELGAGTGFLWLTAGRLDPQKGYDMLLEAFARILPQHAGARLAIAGDGPQRAELAAAVERLELGGSVALLGDRSDVPALLAAADGFVLSSRWEGLPMVLLEAAAARLPIVATDVGGNREVVLPQLGGVLTPVSVAGIAEGMESVMALAPEARAKIGGALRAQVETRYDMTAVVKRWLEVYAGVDRRPERE